MFVIKATITINLVRTIPHIFTCAKRAITTADYLYMNFIDDRTLDDEEVLGGFGFNDWSKVLKIRLHMCDSYSNEIAFLQELYINHNVVGGTIGIATSRSLAMTTTTLSIVSPVYTSSRMSKNPTCSKFIAALMY